MADDAREWQRDEKAHAGPEHLDPGYAAAFDRKSPTDWSGNVATLRALGIGAASTVVDLGAGTGTFCLAIAPHVARVVGVDVSAAMVETMRSRGIEAVQAGVLPHEHEGGQAAPGVTRKPLHPPPHLLKAPPPGALPRLPPPP